MALRDERGQTGAEYLGGLLLVSVVIAATATTNVGASIAAHSKTLVCRIAGSSGCATAVATPTPAPAPTSTPAPAGGDGDAKGPPLETAPPVPGLPFPGSGEVTCTGDGRADGERCGPGDTQGKSAQITVRAEVSRSPTTLDPDGCPWQTLSVRGRYEVGGGLNGENKKGTAEGGVRGYAGAGANYELTVPPGAADDIASRRRSAPNPVDPTTIGVGESVRMSEEFYVGINAEGAYRALQAELGDDTGKRVSSAVTRVSASTVRVTVGDADFVRRELAAGLGKGKAGIGLGNEKDLSGGRLHSIDIDISTPEGWAAYQAFVSTGRLPKTGAAGTSNPSKSETITYADATDLEGKLGPLTLGTQIADAEGSITRTTNADGTVTSTGYARQGGKGIAITATTDAQGKPVGEPTRSITLQDIDPATAAGLAKWTGQPVPANPGGNMRLDFTEAQLSQLQGIAKEAQAKGITAPMVARLAAAKNPDEMLLALYYGGNDPNAALKSLISLLASTGAPVPMALGNRASCS